jgi:hypothetical protein
MTGRVACPPLLIIFTLALLFAGCGGDGGETAGSSSASAANAGTITESGASPKQAEPRAKDRSAAPDSPREGGPAASAVVPETHEDSGGGSDQFVVKGGDNSVQEFGGEADPAEFEEAATALHNFLDARANGNWAAACDYLAAEVVEPLRKLAERVKRLEETGCAGILERLTNPAAKEDLLAEAAKADVGSVRVEGDRAFAIYRAIDGAVIAITMTREGGAWKVASLTGVPLA